MQAEANEFMYYKMRESGLTTRMDEEIGIEFLAWDQALAAGSIVSEENFTIKKSAFSKRSDSLNSSDDESLLSMELSNSKSSGDLIFAKIRDEFQAEQSFN